MASISLFRLLKCDDFMLFPFLIFVNLQHLMYGLLVGQNKHFNNVTYVHFSHLKKRLDDIINEKKNLKIDSENNHKCSFCVYALNCLSKGSISWL